jgi:PAS domain S-box-containing protein
MSKTSPDGSDHCFRERLPGHRFSTVEPRVTVLVGKTGSSERKHTSQTAGLVAVAIAATALIGWWIELPLLASWGSGFGTMKPVVALCLGALGLALVYLGKNLRFAFAVGLAVLLIALFDLGQELLGVDFGIGGLESSTAVVAKRVQMPHATSLGLALASGALVLSRFERYRLVTTVLGGLAGAIGISILLGYLTGIITLYAAASVSSPALPTAVGLLCVAVGIILTLGATPALGKPRPLWRLLVMLGCAIIAPLLLLGTYAAVRVANAQLDQVREGLMTEARILSADVDREIIGEIETLLALGASPSLRQADFAEFQRQAEAALTLRQSGNIVLIDRSMRQLVNTEVPFGTTSEKLAVPEPTEKALATGKPQVTGLFVGAVTKELVYGIIVPVEIDGENRYAVVRSPSPRALARVVGANELPQGQRAAVSDAAHRVIARSEQEDAPIGQELPPTQWHRAGPSSVFEFIDSEGRPSLQANTSSELTGWETAVWSPRAVLEAPVRALWRTLGWMALLALTLVVGFALWLGRSIAHSVGNAAHTAIAWGEGGPLWLDGTPVAEVNTLMTELRKSAARRQRSEDLLRDREQRLQLALNAAQLGSWQYNPLRRVLSGDQRFKEIFDFVEDEVAIDELIKKRVPPEDAQRVRSALDATLDPDDPKPLAVEHRLRREDGRLRWIETHGLTYFEGYGRDRRAIRVVGTADDITERKENAEKAHLLTREINHRAKNMLSVVDAISHQIAAGNPEDFARRFSERIQALSANQDLLIRNEWKGVEIEDLVRAQLAHFADLIGPRIAVQGPRLLLRGAPAQAIGLALHELSTNAGKYGALSNDTGRVDIRWGCDGETLTMSWTERDGPPVSAPERRGFGTIVMKTMAERSLDGAVQLDYAASGLIWRLTCPTANALEPGWDNKQVLRSSGN